MITQGIYEHYKSTPENRMLYQVLLLSHHEETLEVLVHYQPLYFVNHDNIHQDGIAVWTRTLENFSEEVSYGGKMVPRFKRIDSTIEE